MQIEDIEAEILCIILEYVCNGSPKTTKALMLVNKHFHSIVQCIPHRHHRFILSGTIQKSLNRQKQLQEDVVLRNLRHLTVVNRGPWAETWAPELSDISYDDFLERFEPFNVYIRSIKHLRTLTWNAGPIPETLLAVLKEYHPRCELKIFEFGRFLPHLTELDQSEIALGQCTALTHFRFKGGKEFLWQLESEGEDASIALAMNSFGTSVDHHDFGVFLDIASRAPKLEYVGFVAPYQVDELLLDGVSSQKHPISHTIRSLTLDGKITINKAMLVSLEKYVDLGEVKSLKFSRGTFECDFFQSAQNFFTKLQHIALNLRILQPIEEPSHNEFMTTVRQFFLHCHPLQTISVWSWAKTICLDEILSRHGPVLKKLQLHERSDTFSIYDTEDTLRPARVLTLAELTAIRRNCPNLTDLTVDLRSEKLGTTSNLSKELSGKLDELALFDPPLCVLRLYHPELTVDEDDSAVQKHVTSLWKHIYGSGKTGEQRLEVKFGEWDINQWRNDKTDGRRFYEIMPHDRDDMQGECRVDCKKKTKV